MRSNETCQTRIINGEQAEACTWPWQAALLEKNGLNIDFFCGGVIYNDEWIISTASCVQGKDINTLQVILYWSKYSHICIRNCKMFRLKLGNINSQEMMKMKNSDLFKK